MLRQSDISQYFGGKLPCNIKTSSAWTSSLVRLNHRQKRCDHPFHLRQIVSPVSPCYAWSAAAYLWLVLSVQALTMVHWAPGRHCEVSSGAQVQIYCLNASWDSRCRRFGSSSGPPLPQIWKISCVLFLFGSICATHQAQTDANPSKQCEFRGRETPGKAGSRGCTPPSNYVSLCLRNALKAHL
jgi:hypothetical protein